jgi:hypothetical protein
MHVSYSKFNRSWWTKKLQVEVVVVDSTDPFRNDVCAEMGEIKNRIRVVGRDKEKVADISCSSQTSSPTHLPTKIPLYAVFCDSES